MDRGDRDSISSLDNQAGAPEYRRPDPGWCFVTCVRFSHPIVGMRSHYTPLIMRLSGNRTAPVDASPGTIRMRCYRCSPVQSAPPNRWWLGCLVELIGEVDAIEASETYNQVNQVFKRGNRAEE